MEDVKIFEMPVPGYLGFPAFALECFTMYVFVRALYASWEPLSASAAARSRCNSAGPRHFNRPPMTATLEREIKLRFETPKTARAAVRGAGATPLRCRRLQEDCLLDTTDDELRRRRCVLRVRVESGKSLLTFKGRCSRRR